MKKFSIALMIPAIVFLFSCNNFGSPDYTVTVVLGPGVTGTPAAGTYAHKEFDSVDYSYGPQEGASAPTVKVNGSAYSASGTLTMYTNVQIEAYQSDIRGSWHFVLMETSTSTQKSAMDITFSGTNLVNGTFTDSQGNSGEWSVSTDGYTLTLTYSDWFNTVLIGTVNSLSTGGNWTGFNTYGTWTAVQI
jgi:hypothetical protein